MKKHFSSAVCMAALLLVACAATGVAFPPAVAQDVQVDFDTFHDQLAPYGDWVYSDRWGEVWIPTDVSDNFHPYGTSGHWADTNEYGWTWASDYEWGDIPFHYGRWVNDPDDGWMWIPGYVWSPGWVAWRHNGQYTGWMPLPPDDAFLGRARPRASLGINIGGMSISFGSEDNDYGYSRWYGSGYGEDRYAQNWVFVGTGHMADRDYARYQAPHNNYTILIHNTTNITNYTVVNNYIVNRSVDPRAVRQAGGHVQMVRLAEVVKKPQFITRADTGVQIQERVRTERPRGTGFANSAPRPTATVVQSLSVKAPPPHGGHAPMHLFTRNTVANAPLVSGPAKPAAGGGSSAPMGMATPGMKEKTETKPVSPATGPSNNGPMSAPAETKKDERMHDHATAPVTATSPTMSGPPTEMPKKDERMHEHATAPVTATAPTMGGPVSAPTEPKHEHVHENVPAPTVTTAPTMSGPPAETKKDERMHEHATAPVMATAPTMSAPVSAPTEPKHEHVHENVPAPTVTAAPAMSGPPAETKKDERMHEHAMAPVTATAPAMSGPTSTTPPEPKHDKHMDAPVTEHPASAPNAEKPPHEKPKKPDDTQPQ